MGSGTACKEAVAVTVLHYVIPGTAPSRKGSGHGLPPYIDVLNGVFVHHRLTCRTGTYVHFHDSVRRAGSQSVRIVKPEIVFCGERELFYVFKAAYISGF